MTVQAVEMEVLKDAVVYKTLAELYHQGLGVAEGHWHCFHALNFLH